MVNGKSSLSLQDEVILLTSLTAAAAIMSDPSPALTARPARSKTSGTLNAFEYTSGSASHGGSSGAGRLM